MHTIRILLDLEIQIKIFFTNLCAKKNDVQYAYNYYKLIKKYFYAYRLFQVLKKKSVI